MRQNARPNSSVSPQNHSFSSTKHKTFRYVPRSINQTHARKISSDNPPKVEEKKKRITQPKQTPPEPPIPSYLHKKKSDFQSTPRSKPHEYKEQLLRDPSCIALREHLFENGDFENYDDDKLKILLEHLREYSSYSALYRQYDDAERADELQERIKEELQVRSTNNSQGKNQNNTGEGRLKKELQKIQDELDAFDDQTNEKLEQLEGMLQQKVDSFEKKWRDEMPAKYRKPSTKLITIYDVERKLGLNKDFEKAKIVKAEAEQLEAIEMENAQKQLNRDYFIARQKLDAKNNEERQQLIDFRNHRRELLESRLKVIKGNLANRDTVVIMKQNESLKTKDNAYDPTARSPVPGGGAAINRRDYHFKSFNLLPPLLAPNDEKVKEKYDKEIKEQKRKNKKFIMRIREKEREADDSDISFSTKDDWDRDLERLNRNYNNSNMNTKRYQPKSRASTSLSKKRSETSENIESDFNDFLSYQTSEKFTTKTSTTTIENGSRTNPVNNASSNFSGDFESSTSTKKSIKDEIKKSKSSKSNLSSSSVSSNHTSTSNQNQQNPLENLISNSMSKMLNSSISSKSNTSQISSSNSKDSEASNGEQQQQQETKSKSSDKISSFDDTFDDYPEDKKDESEKKSNKLSDSIGKKSDKLSDTSETKSDKLSDSIGKKSDKLSDTSETKSDKLSDSIGKKSDKLSDSIGKKSDKLSDSIGKKSDKLSDSIGKKSDKLSDSIGKKSDKLSDSIGKKSDKLSDSIGKKSDKLSDTSGSIPDKLNELNSLADILSFQSSASNRNLEEELKIDSGTFDLTQTKSFKADKNQKNGK